VGFEVQGLMRVIRPVAGIEIRREETVAGFQSRRALGLLRGAARGPLLARMFHTPSSRDAANSVNACTTPS